MANNPKKQTTACVRCKAQGQGAKYCRQEKRHDLMEHPGTALSGAVCKALMKLRGKEYPQESLTADQQLLEQSFIDDGASGVESALASMKAETGVEHAQPGGDAQPPTDNAADNAAAEIGWEERLCRWPEQIPNLPQYTFRQRRPEQAEAISTLKADQFFSDQLIRADIGATHLTTSNSALSQETSAINCLGNMCDKMVSWMMNGCVGSWECADPECTAQHVCVAGRACDSGTCHLEHPEEELRWVVICNKTQSWAVPMTLDEALHTNSKYFQKALAANEDGCTQADIWRAST